MIHKTKATFLCSVYTLNSFFHASFPEPYKSCWHLCTHFLGLKWHWKLTLSFLMHWRCDSSWRWGWALWNPGEGTCWGMWDYKQIDAIQSVPSFHCPLKGPSHQSIAGHSIATPMQGSPLGWVFLICICSSLCPILFPRRLHSEHHVSPAHLPSGFH